MLYSFWNHNRNARLAGNFLSGKNAFALSADYFMQFLYKYIVFRHFEIS